MKKLKLIFIKIFQYLTLELEIFYRIKIYSIFEKNKETYPIKVRNKIVPIVNIGNTLGYIAIVISLAASLTNLFILGIALISLAVVFQLVTLPCEFNASKRANKVILEMGLIDEHEQKGTKSMLRAAAFTYVAGLFSSILQILRLVYIFSGRRRD